MTTSIIHLIGVQGIGKTTLALDIVAGLNKRGKTALALMENNFVVMESPPSADLEHLREHGIRKPYGRDFHKFDYFIAEHVREPVDLVKRRGDVVIRMELVE